MQGKKRLKKTEKTTLKKVLRLVARYRAWIVLSCVFAVCTVLASLYVPVLVGRVIDLIFGAGQVDFEGLTRVLLAIGIVVAVSAVFQWFMSAVNNRITFQVVRDMRKAAFHKLEILPLKYIDSHPHGDIINRVISDVDQFADGLLMGFTQLFSGIVTIAATLVFMLAVNWHIALVVVFLTPLSLFVARFIAKKTYGLFMEQAETRGEQSAMINETVANLKVVQAFSHEAQSMKRFDEINDRLEVCSRRAAFFSSLPNPTTRFVNSVIYAAVCFVGAFTAIAMPGTLSVGQLTALLSYVIQYTKPFNEISSVITELQNALACAARIFELIEEQPQPEDAADAATLGDIKGNVRLEHVAFSYVPERKLITDLSLTVKPGQRIAIVGPTGCGKTTVINLLMRFYDVDGGRILVEGTDIRDAMRRDVRGAYGMVLQETWLKTGTVRDNITLGKPGATQEEVILAAKASHAHSFIMRLPKGYDTPVSDEGGSLSQGQKQLLCIARVMLCLPPMLILDEATSSIDTRTELKIQSAFSRLMQGRTSFIVAHRLSTIREADVILVMRDGSIIEQGNHDELLRQNGFYAKLYNSQFAV
ncbi:MAG: ABC transporter ATP-binding protein/permease [Oscillospiraceae bacterium]|jgi:ATP-binding cassette subfamily B protein|nr:ABC transporter ATP-binding protein/permease [Oscillospiraceae bacterium]